MNNVIAFHTTRPAKAAGVMCAAILAGRSLGLTPNQCQAMARKAREQYTEGRSSPARAVADARSLMRELSRKEPA